MTRQEYVMSVRNFWQCFETPLWNKYTSISNECNAPQHYSNCLTILHCNPPSWKCIFGSCKKCSGTEPLCNQLQAMACENSIDTVEARQWTQTDHANIETKVMPIDDFIDAFTAMLKKLTIHDITAKMQGRFVQETKENLKEGEYLAIADFSENDSFAQCLTYTI